MVVLRRQCCNVVLVRRLRRSVVKHDIVKIDYLTNDLQLLELASVQSYLFLLFALSMYI